MPTQPHLHIAEPIQRALDAGDPVVALESTVISHGLPRPTNLEAAQQVETAIRDEGAIPATIGIIDGVITVGLTNEQLELLANAEDVRKVSRRDYPIVAARKSHGATTVAGTMIAAHRAGIPIFATGGIGGVHRGDAMDISADLPELGRTPVVVVCAGAKSILDLPRTLEWLETHGVPVLGYQTDTFPAFYATSSDLPIDARVDAPADAAAIIRAKRELNMDGGVLITVPPPADLALDYAEMELAVEAALRAADGESVTGKELTPFLLDQIGTITEGRSLAVNVALLERNARVAAQIAIALAAEA